MSWQVVPYTTVLLLAAFISVIVVIFALRVRLPSGARSAFIIFMSGVTLWSACYALEVASSTLQAKLFWANSQYLGVLIVPPALLVFLLLYTHQEKWLKWPIWVFFAAITSAFLALVWTDQKHHLLRESLTLTLSPIPELVFEWGPLYQAVIIYFYIILFLCALALVRSIFQSTPYYRGQAFALLVAISIPWGASVVEVIGLDPIPHLSPIVFSFILSGGIFVWAFWRYRLLDILPVAQHAIFENLPDGIIVLDGRRRISNLNPAACRMVDVDENEVIGISVVDILPEMEEILSTLKSAEICVQRTDVAYYEVLISELYWKPQNPGGFLLVMREITQRKHFEAALRQSEMQYRSVSEHANDGIAILQDNKICYLNPQLSRMLGYDLERILNQPFYSLISERDREMAVQRYQDRMEGKQVPSRYEIALLHQSGSEIFVEVNASLTEYEEQTADLIFVRDISEQKRVRDELTAKNQALEEAVEHANQMKEMALQRARELETIQQASRVVSAVLEQEETIQRILEQIERVVSYDSASVQLQQDGHLKVLGCRGFSHPDEIKGLLLPIAASNPGAIVFNSGKPLILADVQERFPSFREPPHNHIHGWMGIPLILKNTTLGIISLDSRQKDHFSDEDARLASVFADQVSIALENTRLFEEVQRLAIIDPLTNLYNRRHFYSLTQQEYLRCKRYGTSFSLIMIDVDHFKQINDTYGHLAGDKVLQSLADEFRQNMRKVDILCRFGGEEFIAALPETHVEEAFSLAERLRTRISSTMIKTDAGEVPVTVSIGVAEFGRGCSTIDTLLDCVDKALYAAKSNGRNRVSLYLEQIGD